MKEITVQNESITYRIYIDNAMDKLHVLLDEYKIKSSDKIFIITDDMLFNMYSDGINRFWKGFNFYIFCFKHGEENKNNKTLFEIYDFLIDNNADKNSVIIAFGGGVVSDIAAYASSTFMNGIRFINIPTTLISQVDGCIEGMSGFNYRGIRNIIGSYYNPMFVYISINFLKSLSEEHFISGLGEIIKYGIIKDKTLFNYINENSSQIMEKENDRLLFVIRYCLAIKAGVLKEDSKDTGLRNILRFGHLVGNAIEESSSYSFLHGNAVALGMLAAIKLSEIKLGLPKENYANIVRLYKKLGLPTTYKVDNFASFLYAINRDKKNTGENKFVLLKQLGECKMGVAVNESELIEALKSSICGGN